MRVRHPVPTLMLLVRKPVAGKVKTRLGRDIGMVRAAWWYRHQCAALMRELAPSYGNAARGWRLCLCVTPDAAAHGPRPWPAATWRQPQGAGDLGARMGRAFREARPGRVLIIGSDIPGIRRAHIARAFRALACADAVIGPSADGGYWAVGLKRIRAAPRAAQWQGIRWSSPFARADTLARLRSTCRVAPIDALRDVDTGADLRALRWRAGEDSNSRPPGS